MTPPRKSVSFEDEQHQEYLQNRSLAQSPTLSNSSQSTEELPRRFDRHGQSLHYETPAEELLHRIGDTVDDIIGSKGAMGNFLKSLSSRLDSPGSGRH